MKTYRSLSKDAKRDRMVDALNAGGTELREFISKLAKEYGVPEVEFKFWLLQQENYISFEDTEFEIKETQ